SRAIPRNTSPIAEAAPLATLHGPGLANGALISAFNPGESFDMVRRLRLLSLGTEGEDDGDDGDGEVEDWNGVGVGVEALAASDSCGGCSCACPE
ncbi:hypothetical protein TARUN_4023, partial [Trichoderma arundinaceum]